MANTCDLQKRIFTRLSTATAVSGLVADRVYPDELPHKATLPAVTFSLISSNFEHAFGSDPGNVRSRYQVTYWDLTHSAAIGGREAVRASLSRYRATTGCPTIDDTFVEGQFSFHEEDRAEQTIHQAITDFMFFHEVVTVYFPMVTGDVITGFSLADTGWRWTATGDTINGVQESTTGWVHVSRGATDTLSRWEEV